MRASSKVLVSILAVTALGLFDAPAAVADEQKGLDWRNGKVRLELQGMAALRSGRRSRSGDIGFHFAVEYEMPATPRLTFSARAIPFFYYDQDDSGEDTVTGAGLGVGIRVYQVREEYRGFFWELNTNLIGQSGEFEGNSGDYNFLLATGGGYKFKGPWHVSAKFQHISNAGLASHNSGINTITFGLGYSF